MLAYEYTDNTNNSAGSIASSDIRVWPSANSVWSSANLTMLVTTASSTDSRNVSANQTVTDGYVLSEDDHQRVIIIAMLMAFTIIGNMTLIFVLLCKRSRRKKRVNILLVNLAFGDLAVAVFVNSTEILFLAFGDWALGPIVCKISVYVQMICLSSATNLLTTMSIDRYQVIVKPMQSLAKRSRIMLKVVIAWVLSLLFPIPQLFIFVQYNSGLKFDGTPRRICGSRGYTSPWQRKVYFTYTTVYILIVPMLIMLYCYAKIIKVVWIRAKNETSSCVMQTRSFKTSSACSSPAKSASNCATGKYKQENSSWPSSYGYDVTATGGIHPNEHLKRAQQNKKDKYSSRGHPCNKTNYTRHEVDDEDSTPGSPRMSVRRGLVSSSKRRVLIMTLTVVVSFLVCHTPYFCITLVRIYSDYKLKLEMAMVVSEFMVLVHSTLNPILYGLFTLREYHIKYAVALLMCSKRSIAQPRKRFLHYSDERHELLTSVRSRLVSFTYNGGTTTVVAHNSYNTNIHVNPLIDVSSHIESAPQSKRVPQSVSSSDTPLSSSLNLKDSRSKSVPVVARTLRKKQHASGTLVSGSVDVNQSSNVDDSVSEENELWKLRSRQLLTHSASQ